MQNTNPAPHEQIFSLVLSFWQARTVAVATELDLAGLLAAGPLHVDELAARTKTNALALFRLLRALESIGIFTQTTPRVFANTPTSDSLRSDVAGTQRAFVLHALSQGYGLFEGWRELRDAVQTGEPSLDKVYGYDFWELCRRNPDANAAFNGAMRAGSMAMTPTVTAAYDWSQFPVIADIGGGIGTQLTSILDSSPSSKGILFDQPQLGADAIPHDRVEVVGGDFFDAVPGGADAYLLRFILHDWSDPKALAILAAVRRALKPAARLFVIESLVLEGPEFGLMKWIDLQMLVGLGGRERTENEFRDMLAATGFEVERVVPTTSLLSLLIAKPV